MSGLSRYVKVLRLFGDTKSNWTVPEISIALNIPASTVYRTIRELVAESLLEPAADAHYRLGAAFVEFDRLVRVTDPLYQAGTVLLKELAAQARIPCVAVLARLYGETVMCVADAASADRTNTHELRARPTAAAHARRDVQGDPGSIAHPPADAATLGRATRTKASLRGERKRVPRSARRRSTARLLRQPRRGGQGARRSGRAGLNSRTGHDSEPQSGGGWQGTRRADRAPPRPADSGFREPADRAALRASSAPRAGEGAVTI